MTITPNKHPKPMNILFSGPKFTIVFSVYGRQPARIPAFFTPNYLKVLVL